MPETTAVLHLRIVSQSTKKKSGAFSALVQECMRALTGACYLPGLWVMRRSLFPKVRESKIGVHFIVILAGATTLKMEHDREELQTVAGHSHLSFSNTANFQHLYPK